MLPMPAVEPRWNELCKAYREEIAAGGGSLRRRQEEFLDRVAREFGSESARLATAREIAADAVVDFDPALAAEGYSTAFSAFERLGAPADCARTGTKLGRIYEQAGRTEEALASYRLTLEQARRSGDSPQLTAGLNHLAMLHKEAGRLEEACRLFAEALEQAIACHGSNHPEVALLASNLGVTLSELGDLAGAEQRHMQALGIREALYGANHPDVALTMGNLGTTYHLRGETRKARAFYEGALEIFAKFPGVNAEERRILEQNLHALS